MRTAIELEMKSNFKVIFQISDRDSLNLLSLNFHRQLEIVILE